jgi:hypothetical protein
VAGKRLRAHGPKGTGGRQRMQSILLQGGLGTGMRRPCERAIVC